MKNTAVAITALTLTAAASLSSAATGVGVDVEVEGTAWEINQRGFYAGLGYTVITGNSGTVFDSAEMPVLELTGGYKHNSVLGLEARFGVGVNEDRDRDSDYFEWAQGENENLMQIEREVDSYSAVYYRPELTNNHARLYGLIGYASVDLSAEWTETDADEVTTVSTKDTSLSGMSYGFGVGWYVGQRWNFNLEYRRLVHTDDYKPEAFGLKLDYRF